MNWDRAKEIGTCGCCGTVAVALLQARGGVPLLRYDSEGVATHAAVLLDGVIVHWGDDDERLVPVTLEELDRACREDFYSDRINLEDGEIQGVIDLMFPTDE